MDNWGFVAAAYLFAGVLLGGYWRRLVRLDRQLGHDGPARRGHRSARR